MSSIIDESSLAAARASLGGLLRSVPTLAALRLLTGTDLDGFLLLGGSTSPGDGSGGLYYWSAATSTADNGTTVIRPSSILSTQPGRWIYVGQINSGGITGATNDAGGVGLYDAAQSTATNLHFKALIAGANFTITDNGDGTITLAPTPVLVTTGLIENIDVLVQAPTDDPVTGTITVRLTCTYGFTLNEMSQLMSAGSCTVNVRKNGISVTGLDAVACSTAPSTTPATANNVFVAGDTLDFVISAPAAAANLALSFKTTRT